MVYHGDYRLSTEGGVEVGLVQLVPEDGLQLDDGHQLGHELIQQSGSHWKGVDLDLLGL